MSIVEFEEGSMSKILPSHTNQRGVGNFLIRKGIVKNEKTLRYITIVFSLVILGLSAFFAYRNLFGGGKPVNYSELPTSVKDKFPVSAQKLYQ